MDTTNKIIKCKAAVAWKLNEPLTIEEVEVYPPKANEVRVKIIASAICRSDLHNLNGHFPGSSFPCVLGHEGAGIVESIGPGVTSVEKGDHVLPCFLSQCNECRVCQSREGNFCPLTNFSPMMRDNTSRFRCKEQYLSHFSYCSTFAEYTVIPETNLTKVSKLAPLEKICLISCGVGTGFGAATKVAKVTPGSSCAVWGLGAIGLSVVMGCHINGAKQIIAVDVNDNKEGIARQMGATHFFNPLKNSKPSSEALSNITDGGLDYTFECIGNKNTIKEAFDSCHQSIGTCVLVGVPAEKDILEVSPLALLSGKKLMGTFYGGLKPQNDIPKLVDDYMNKKIKLDELITKVITLEQINEGIQDLKDGKVVRVVLKIGDV